MRPAHGFRWQSTSNEFIKPAHIINEVPEFHLNISSRAADRLGQIYKESKEILRVTVESGGCHGYQYNLKLVPEEDIKVEPSEEFKSDTGTKDTNENIVEDFEDDFENAKDVVYVLPETHAQVAIDEQSLKILNNTTLTYTTELIGSTFKIAGGNMTSSCGCGSSFGLDQE